MTRPVKIALAASATLAALLVVLAMLASSVDMAPFKERITALLRDTTGLEATFDGKLEVGAFPSLSATVEGVTLRSPLDPPGTPLARLGSAKVSLKLLPLLSGRVEAGSVLVRGLAVNLRRDAQGRLNLPVPPVKSVSVEGEKVVVVTEQDQRYTLDYQLAGLEVTESGLSWDDQAAGTKLRLEGVRLKAGHVASGKAFPVEFALDYASDAPRASGKVELSGQAQAWPEALRFAFENASFRTTLSGEGLPVATAEAVAGGTLRADFREQVFAGERLKLAVKAAGGALPQAGAALSLGLDARADLGKGAADLTGLALEASGLKITGEAHATGLPRAARLEARLASESFDLGALLASLGITIKDAGPAGFSLALTADQAAGSVQLSSLKLQALGLDLSGSAQATLAPSGPAVKGSLTLAPCDPRAVLRKLGVALEPSAPDALASLGGIVAFEHAGAKTSLSTRDFQLDRQPLSLSAGVDRSGSRPKVDFAFKAASLDVDRLLPKERAGPPKASPQTGRTPPPAASGLDVRGVVDVGALKAARLHLRDVHAGIVMKGNTLEVDPLRLSLYQGSLQGSLSTGLEPGPGRPLSVKARAEGVQLEPLLKDLTGKARITGRAGLTAALTAKGDDQAQVLSSLNGRFAFALRDGTIPGVDLSPGAFSTPEKVAAQGSGQGGTRYESIGGSFAVANGVASGNDMRAVVPPHRVDGQGQVNLPARTLDYRLVVHFAKVASIPVHLTGSLESPGVSVDASALAGLAAKGVLDAVTGAPGAVIKTPGDLGKGALDTLGNILGGSKKR